MHPSSHYQLYTSHIDILNHTTRYSILSLLSRNYLAALAASDTAFLIQLLLVWLDGCVLPLLRAAICTVRRAIIAVMTVVAILVAVTVAYDKPSCPSTQKPPASQPETDLIIPAFD